MYVCEFVWVWWWLRVSERLEDTHRLIRNRPKLLCELGAPFELTFTCNSTFEKWEQMENFLSKIKPYRMRYDARPKIYERSITFKNNSLVYSIHTQRKKEAKPQTLCGDGIDGLRFHIQTGMFALLQRQATNRMQFISKSIIKIPLFHFVHARRHTILRFALRN